MLKTYETREGGSVTIQPEKKKQEKNLESQIEQKQESEENKTKEEAK